jgi:hypothetical protein
MKRDFQGNRRFPRQTIQGMTTSRPIAASRLLTAQLPSGEMLVVQKGMDQQVHALIGRTGELHEVHLDRFEQRSDGFLQVQTEEGTLTRYETAKRWPTVFTKEGAVLGGAALILENHVD